MNYITFVISQFSSFILFYYSNNTSFTVLEIISYTSCTDIVVPSNTLCAKKRIESIRKHAVLNVEFYSHIVLTLVSGMNVHLKFTKNCLT